MADDVQTRKLATIVALDVAGYSARTEADEARTTAEVAALRKVIEAIAAKHGGRVFNTAGDGFMLEFGSSLSAVEAASELAATCEPKVRVGVHLGDVVVQPNGDLLGHGVNVAARLMAKSDPGGALVSADVRRTIRGPLGERLISRGVMQLDKMAETIEAFALRIVTATPATPDVFLSYARDDQTTARKFAEALEREGLAVWWDVALRSGDAYDETMERALKAAKAVVVLWSKASVESRWVRSEATLADRNKTLVPCMIEACERPVMFELTQTAELAHWQGEPTDRAWLTFLTDVRRFVGREAPAAAPRIATAPASAQETLKPGQRGDAPSLAVLPFTNRSGQADDDVFAIGLVEDVISALSQGVDVRVLGASATAALTKQAITDLAAVARQLGVRYLLEGNVRRAGTNLRVTTQLLEAGTGSVLWTGKFDRPLSELANLQEDLVLDLAASLNVEVSSIEIERALQKPDDISVWQMLQRAQYIGHTGDPLVNVDTALVECERALALAPDYALANAVTAYNLIMSMVFSGRDDPETVQRARRLADRALKLAPHDPAVMIGISQVHAFTGAPNEALRQTSIAVRKLPGSGMAHFQHAFACGLLDRSEEGLRHMTTAGRLMPGSYMLRLVNFWLAEFCRRLGRFAEATAHIDEVLNVGGSPNIHMLKARIALSAGDEATARQHVAIARRAGIPIARLEAISSRFYPHGPDWDQWASTLRRLWAEVEPGA
ncbi:MAG: TIR domain-containing protein [Micropepsaceae bacterium]